MIVDDNETNRRILTSKVESWGMRSVAVDSGAKALDLLREGMKFNVALLDMHMPEMDGLMLAKEIRRLRSSSHLPLAMLSSGAATRADLCAEGTAKDLFAFVLTKPVKPSLLFEGMQSALTAPATQGRVVKADHEFDHQMGQRLPLRILVAEDNVVNQRVILRCLERIGYRPDVVATGWRFCNRLNGSATTRF